jgi:ribose transport system substrate-binding protein
MRLLLPLLLVCVACATAAAEVAPITIAVIPKGTTHEFWKAVHAGAVKAGRELTAAGTPVTIRWQGPVKEDDRTSQVDLVNTIAAQGVAGIVLAPLDHKALVKPVELAVKAKVPVVIIDSGLESEAQTSLVATDNKAGGAMAAKHLAGLLNGQGKVLLLRYLVGSASTGLREAGFLDALKEFPGITVVSQDQYAGATRATALTASQTLLNRWGSGLDAVFTPNESSTAGMAQALKQLKLNRTVKHVGFDASPVLLEGLQAGDIQGLIVQDPFNMGYLGVTTLAAHLAGKPVSKQTDTPAQLVTPANLNEPAIQALLSPPLKQFLGE